MIGSIALISGLVVFLVVPIISLLQYYSPKQYSTPMNVFWILIGIVTWPVIPVILFIRNQNKILNWVFWVGMIIFVITFNIWMLANLNFVIELLHK